MSEGSADNGHAGRGSETALLTDLYQLTMLDAYYQHGMEAPATFEFFVRRMSSQRNFLIAAGVDQVLDYLERLRFSAEDIEWLRSTGRFSDVLLEQLREFRFTGDVYAMREGTVFFPGEPLLRITAPLPQAQFVESRVINLLQLQSVIASKAVRCRLAAPHARIVDFGMRRAHGAEAALLAARACYIAGFDATATVEAGRRFGIPITGTMAHSFIQAHDQEINAFRNFARAQPSNVTLLIDTYDTLRGAQRVTELVRELAAEGISIHAVRIDSGDLESQARAVRVILDQGGCRDVKIFVSGGLDEYDIQKLTSADAPIDGFGVGTRIDVSEDAPVLDCAYKLQEFDGRPTCKRSPGKEHLPGVRQVFRNYDALGKIVGDVIGRSHEKLPGRPLLEPVMRNGKRLNTPSLVDIRSYCRTELTTLPAPLLQLREADPVPVAISPALQALAKELHEASH
jgi:nicotinate phosphoribosyltransferase